MNAKNQAELSRVSAKLVVYTDSMLSVKLEAFKNAMAVCTDVELIAFAQAVIVAIKAEQARRGLRPAL